MKENEKKGRSKCLLFAWILALIYVVYLISYFFGGMANATSTAEAAGTGIATALVLPHAICIFIGVIFNILGYFLNKQGFALTAGILYAVSMGLFPLYIPFILVQMILAFVGYSKVKKINSQS